MKPVRAQDLVLVEFVRTLPCVACARPGPSEAHHVTTRGAGGHDVPENLMPLCPFHHQKWHESPRNLIRECPSVRFWLEGAGRDDVLERYFEPGPHRSNP